MINNFSVSGWDLKWVNPAALTAVPEWPGKDQQRAVASLTLNGRPFPVFIGPDGWPDRHLLRFATRGWLKPKSRATVDTYAKDINVWLRFLHIACGGRYWLEAHSENFLDFHYWRTREAKNRGRVAGDNASRGLAALTLLYGWAEAEELIARDPIRRLPSRSGRQSAPVQQPRNSNHKDVKWLTRRAFERWKQIGFGGYGADGLPRPGTRVRTQSRSVAFADLLFATGLRLREGGALLDIELPALSDHTRLLVGHLAAGIAKFRKRRVFYAERRRLRAIEEYLRFERKGAVHLANLHGRYERMPNRLIVTDVTGSGKDRVLTWVSEHGVRSLERLDSLEAETRARLLRRTPQGWEPLWLWLTETGLPMKYESWDKTFEKASERCSNVGVSLDVTPHMLRHSFALHMLVQAQRAFLLRAGLTADERTQYQRLFGNVWELVRDLLGHASVETTRERYLQPVRGLQWELLLDAADDSPLADVDAVIGRIGTVSGLVQDIPEEPTE